MDRLIRTPRLLLRPLGAGDAEPIAAALSDFEVTRWLTRAPFPYHLRDAQSFLAAIPATASNGTGFWAILLEGQTLIGVISHHQELGFWLARRHWGQGYMTEAAGAVLHQIMMAGTGPIHSGHHPGNTASARIQAKTGFRYTGVAEPVVTGYGTRTRIDRTLLTPAAWCAAKAGLSFRNLEPGDYEPLHRIVSQWDVTRQLGRWPWPPDPDFTKSRCKSFDGDGFVWAILQDGTFAGTVGVTDGQLGYMLAPDYHGKGIATHAARAAIAWTFATRDTPTIRAKTWADNPASTAVLDKLGFRPAGEGVEQALARGRETPFRSFVLERTGTGKEAGPVARTVRD